MTSGREAAEEARLLDRDASDAKIMKALRAAAERYVQLAAEAEDAVSGDGSSYWDPSDWAEEEVDEFASGIDPIEALEQLLADAVRDLHAALDADRGAEGTG